MRIAILGTRGIPNNYGGFEQISMHLALGLTKKGHEVTVYNSHNHPYQEATYEKIEIKHCYDPEHKIGIAGQFIYDFNCLMDARKKDFDVLLFMGYTSSSVWGPLFPKKPVIISNMDGLEWKRNKYSRRVKQFLKKAEEWAIKYSDHYIADSVAIADHLKKTYDTESCYIPYGAIIPEKDSFPLPDGLPLREKEYHLLIARMEPENNIEMILDGYLKSGSRKKFALVGNITTKYGDYVRNKYVSNTNIVFLGGIFDQSLLESLRQHCSLYFHGHSVGGTNPSLLEAMASQSKIIAHNNPFNKVILGNDARYFSCPNEISSCLINWEVEISEEELVNNLTKIETHYNWQKVVDAYELFIKNCYLEKNHETEQYYPSYLKP